MNIKRKSLLTLTALLSLQTSLLYSELTDIVATHIIINKNSAHQNPLEYYTIQITTLADDSQKMVEDFLDPNNNKSYDSHLAKMKNNIFTPVDSILKELSETIKKSSSNKEHLTILKFTQTILKDIKKRLNRLHKILKKYKGKKQALRLAQELNPLKDKNIQDMPRFCDQLTELRAMLLQANVDTSVLEKLDEAIEVLEEQIKLYSKNRSIWNNTIEAFDVVNILRHRMNCAAC